MPSRPRSSSVPSCRPPHDDRPRVRVRCLQARGRGRVERERSSWRTCERASNQTQRAAGSSAHDLGLLALVGARGSRGRFELDPTWISLGDGLARSHASCVQRRREALRIERRAPRQHEARGPAERVGEDRERFALAGALLQLDRAPPALGAVSHEEGSGFGGRLREDWSGHVLRFYAETAAV